jgi:hypothetical protein
MWICQQSTGHLYSPSCELIATSYSGHGPDGKNKPSAQAIHDVGPIPIGHWQVGAPHDRANTGPYSLPLSPQSGTETYGRSAFLCHGDSASHPGEARHGCIIMPRPVRERIIASGDLNLWVIA